MKVCDCDLIPVKTVAAAVLGVACAVLVLGVLSGTVFGGTSFAPAAQNTNGQILVPSNSTGNIYAGLATPNGTTASPSASYGAIAFQSSWPTLAFLSAVALALGLSSMFVISKKVGRTKEENLEAEKN
jgi:hypothetical protein